jgi:hypothetical protein
MPLTTARQIFLDGCREIADALAPDGLSFAKSGPKLVRKQEGRQHEIRFLSNRYNDAKTSVELRVQIAVYDKRLAAFRKSKPEWPIESAFVGGSDLTNLSPHLATVEWNLLTKGTVAKVVDAIRHIGLPYVALLSDPEALERELFASDVRGIAPSVALDVLYCLRGADAARAYATAVLARHRNVAPRVKRANSRALRGARERGTANVYDDLGVRLAQLGIHL